MSISAMFINVETTRGLLQFAAYNEHNGYYGHDVLLVSKYEEAKRYLDKDYKDLIIQEEE